MDAGKGQPRVFLPTGEELVGDDGVPLVGPHPLDHDWTRRAVERSAESERAAMPAWLKNAPSLIEVEVDLPTVDFCFFCGLRMPGVGERHVCKGPVLYPPAAALIGAETELEPDYEALGYPETRVGHMTDLSFISTVALEPIASWLRLYTI